MQRYELTDEHWSLIEPILPPQRRTTRGGVWRDHRTVVNGIFWVLFSGAAWRDMPERYGSCKTAHDRLARWQRDGTWDKVLCALRLRADERGLLDYSQYNADTTSIHATRAAGGARKKAGRKRLE
ncbi:MAG: transposase [Burkholderiales bacterium]|nr:transposase [Phycisphaerae bacterium]